MVDAGPFSHLDQIGHLALLKALPTILVPASVLSECSDQPTHRHLGAIRRWPNLEVVTVPIQPESPVARLRERATLQRGELDCLALARERQPCTFLTDDLAARRAAERLGLDVHGTVGLIAYAVRHRWLSLNAAEQALDRLYHRSTLFITYEIIAQAIRRLRESS